MEENRIKVDVVVYSDKESNVSLGFGSSITEKEYVEGEITDFEWVSIGVSDSFCELYCDFEPGMLKARNLVEKGQFETLLDALHEVFGHFHIVFYIDDVEKEFVCDYDIDADLYPMIESTARVL